MSGEGSSRFGHASTAAAAAAATAAPTAASAAAAATAQQQQSLSHEQVSSFERIYRPREHISQYS